jgi:CheY-like chemotaxis protein
MPPQAATVVPRSDRKILVVDDDADNRELLVELLALSGYSAVAAENGVEALTHLDAGLAPDLVLTDLTMPLMSGWDLCETLKKSKAWRSIPVIVLCGVPADQRGKLQAEDAFDKPMDFDRLLRRIGELCDA